MFCEIILIKKIYGKKTNNEQINNRQFILNVRIVLLLFFAFRVVRANLQWRPKT